jgi:RNA polymerase sigma-70 factor (ECF subfamily)
MGGYPITERLHAVSEDGERAPADIPRLRRSLSLHFGVVWRSLRRWGVPLHAVDDAAQQVFMIFADRAHQVELGRERAFLVATAVRVAANARRRHERSREVPTDNLDTVAAQTAHPFGMQGATPEQLLDWKQRREKLDIALDELPFEQRTVFVLFELEGFSLPEIADALAIPLGTATSRLRRARHAFEEWIAQQSNEGGEP